MDPIWFLHSHVGTDAVVVGPMKALSWLLLRGTYSGDDCGVDASLNLFKGFSVESHDMGVSKNQEPSYGP